MVEAAVTTNATSDNANDAAVQPLDGSTQLEHTYQVWCMVKQTRQQ